MLNKFALLLLITAVFISGCVDNDNRTNTTVKPDLIPQTNLPAGFTYMGTHEISISIGDVPMNATEGVYRTSGGEDIYIQVIKNDNPDTLATQYKQQFKTDKYNPFEEISFNGHKATKVTDYIRTNGQTAPRYHVFWAKEKNMIIIGSSENPQTVIALATATGY